MRSKINLGFKDYLFIIAVALITTGLWLAHPSVSLVFLGMLLLVFVRNMHYGDKSG